MATTEVDWYEGISVRMRLRDVLLWGWKLDCLDDGETLSSADKVDEPANLTLTIQTLTADTASVLIDPSAVGTYTAHIKLTTSAGQELNAPIEVEVY